MDTDSLSKVSGVKLVVDHFFRGFRLMMKERSIESAPAFRAECNSGYQIGVAWISDWNRPGMKCNLIDTQSDRMGTCDSEKRMPREEILQLCAKPHQPPSPLPCPPSPAPTP